MVPAHRKNHRFVDSLHDALSRAGIDPEFINATPPTLSQISNHYMYPQTSKVPRHLRQGTFAPPGEREITACHVIVVNWGD